jgi:hypothetical protein
MSKANLVLLILAIVVFAIGFYVGKANIPKISGVSEGFGTEQNNFSMNEFLKSDEVPAANEKEEGVAAGAEGFADSGNCVPDASKYVLRSTIPPCKECPNMDRYILKSEVPSQIDLSKYVLKSSVPKCAPCICANAKPAKIGACPPPQRCPVCPPPPEPKPCPAYPEVVVKPCDSPRINCKAEYKPDSAPRPLLSSVSAFGY